MGKRIIAMLLAAVLSLSFILSASAEEAYTEGTESQTAALAEKLKISIPVAPDLEGQNVLTGLGIDGVDEPVPGKALDDTAEVSSAQGIDWEIPVFWIDDDSQIVNIYTEGQRIIPVLAFYVPEDCKIELGEDGLADVILSPYLTRVFGSGAATLYMPKERVTYITAFGYGLDDIIASLSAKLSNASQNSGTDAGEDAVSSDDTQNEETPDYISLYCSETAKAAVEAEELMRVLDIIINRLHPQAVNKLMDSFPAFRAAADEGGISSNIGLYVYYQKGDNDTFAHMTSSGAQAAVALWLVENEDSTVTFGNIVQIDLYGILTEDEDGNLTADTESDDWHYLESVMLHEFMHAFMYDYNRTGMTGTNDPDLNSFTLFSNGQWDEMKLYDLYDQWLSFPGWFDEGVASTVQNPYYENGDLLEYLKDEQPDENGHYFTDDSIIINYILYGDCFHLFYETEFSMYMTGYLAVMYLSELAAKNDSSIGSGVSTDENGELRFDSGKMRQGLNSILERLHNGESLDEVICDISDGLYADTFDFEDCFIVGRFDDEEGYQGDQSLYFVTDMLNYLEDVSARNGSPASGSLLLDFDESAQSIIDSDREDRTGYFNFNGSDDFVPSDANMSVPYRDGGLMTDGGNLPSYENITEGAQIYAESEWSKWTEKNAGINWNEISKYDAAVYLSHIYFYSNLSKALDMISGREDFMSIVTMVAYAAWDFDMYLTEMGYDYDFSDVSEDDIDALYEAEDAYQQAISGGARRLDGAAELPEKPDTELTDNGIPAPVSNSNANIVKELDIISDNGSETNIEAKDEAIEVLETQKNESDAKEETAAVLKTKTTKSDAKEETSVVLETETTESDAKEETAVVLETETTESVAKEEKVESVIVPVNNTTETSTGAEAQENTAEINNDTVEADIAA